MIKIWVTLNEGQGQHNEHVMHYHAWGSYYAKFDDDNFNSFWGIICEGATHRQTDRHTQTLASSIWNFFKDVRLQKQNKNHSIQLCL